MPPVATRARPRWIPAIIGVVIGVIWTIGQFTANELLFRISEREILPYPLSDYAFTLSNVITWPAEPIYNAAEKRRVTGALTDTFGNQDIPSDTQGKLRQLVDQGAVDPDHENYYEIFEILDSVGTDPSVPTSLEYLIYGGTCVVYGILIGGIAGLIAWKIQPTAVTPAR